MKILFKNTTKYTKERYNDFTNFHTKKYGVKELLKIILMSICTLYILVFNIIYKNWLIILGLIAVGIIFYLLDKQMKEKDKKNREKAREFTFYFYEKHIKIKYRRQFERLKYFELHKIFETDKYFFLYLDEKNSLILSKEGFSVGTPREFSKFIKNKCPFKYSNQNK